VGGSDHLKRRALGIAAVDLVAVDHNIFKALLLPLIPNVFGELIVALGSGDVRFLGKDAMLAAFFVRSRDGLELGLDGSFTGGRSRCEPEDLSLGCCGQRYEKHKANESHDLAGTMLSGFGTMTVRE